MSEEEEELEEEDNGFIFEAIKKDMKYIFLISKDGEVKNICRKWI